MVSDRARAYHEAAHAVIAIVLGISVEYATIEYTTDKNGRKIHGHTKYKDVEYKSKKEEAIAISNSFIAAFAPIYTVDRIGEELAAVGCISDVDKVKTALANVPAQESEVIFQVADNEAKKEVDKNWTNIEAVAQELLIKRKLNGNEIRRILNDFRS